MKHWVFAWLAVLIGASLRVAITRAIIARFSQSSRPVAEQHLSRQHLQCTAIPAAFQSSGADGQLDVLRHADTKQ